MDLNLFQNLIQIAPGFVGVAVCKLMNGDVRKEKLNNEVLKYFLYTAAAWLATNVFGAVMALLGINFGGDAHIVCAIACAAVLGVLWPVWLQDQAVFAANAINRLFGKNPIFVEETILEKLGCDNKPHYYEAYKNGKLVAAGWGEHFIKSEKSFSLRLIDGYGKEDLQEYRSIIWQDKDMVLKEYALKETND